MLPGKGDPASSVTPAPRPLPGWGVRAAFSRRRPPTVIPSLAIHLAALPAFLLATLSFPPLQLWPAGLVALAPLMWALPRLSAGWALVNGMLFGAWTGGYAFWGGYAYHPLAWLAVVAACGLVMGIAGWAFRRLATLGGGWLAPLPWLLAEQLLQALGVPWSFALMVGGEPALLQSAAFGGAGWITLSLLLLQWGGVQAWRVRGPERYRRLFLVLLALVLLSIDPSTPLTGDPLRVAVVQTDISRSSSATAADSGRLESLLEQRRRGVERALAQEGGESPELIVLPELSFPGFEFVGGAPLADLARSGGVTLLLSSPHLLADGRPANAVFSLSPDGRVGGIHLQSRTIPILERGYLAGSEVRPLDSTPGSPGTLICYESTLPGPARMMTAAGAGLLVVTSSDAYAGPSVLAALHLMMDRIRAIENRRYLVRAANGGPSAVIDPRGGMVAQLGVFEEGVLHASVTIHEELSPYSRHALLFHMLWWLAGLTALAVAFLGGGAVIRGEGSATRHARGGAAAVASTGVLALLPLVVALQWQHQKVAADFRPAGREGAPGPLFLDPFPGAEGWRFETFPQVSTLPEAEAAALALLMRLYGRPVSPARLLEEGHSSLEGMARRHGLCARLLESRPTGSQGGRSPWLARLSSGWPVTVREMDERAVLLFDPRRRGWVILRTEAFLEVLGWQALRLVACGEGRDPPLGRSSRQQPVGL